MNFNQEALASETEKQLMPIVKVYVSGPITSIGETEARKRFKEGEEQVKTSPYINYFFKQKYECDVKIVAINPMELTHNHDKSYEAYLAEDLKWLASCEAIFFMEGFHESKGCVLEFLNSRDKVIFNIEKGGIQYNNWGFVKERYLQSYLSNPDLMDELEELEDIIAYDKAKKEGGEYVPFKL